MREYAAGLAVEGGTVPFCQSARVSRSSTGVRALAAKRAGRWTALCPESVAAYIARHHLYTPAAGGGLTRLVAGHLKRTASGWLLRARIEAT